MTRDEILEQHLEIFGKGRSGLAHISQRVGKTRLAIKLISKRKIELMKQDFKVLWVSPSQILLSKDLPLEIIKWGSKDILKNLHCTTYRTFSNVEGMYDLIIFDEYQKITDDVVQRFLYRKIRAGQVVGFSGSHPTDAEKAKYLRTLKLDILQEVTREQAIEWGIVADYNINLISCNLNAVDKSFYTSGKTKLTPVTELMKHNSLNNMMVNTGYAQFAMANYRKFIATSQTKELALITLLKYLEGTRKIVFCGSVDQAERLGGDKAHHSKIKVKKGVITAIDKFVSEEINELFLVNIGGTGFTFKGVEDLILVQATKDKTGDSSQKITRTLLYQGEEYTGRIWILKLEGTRDSDWVSSFLQTYPEDKINILKFTNYGNKPEIEGLTEK